jgi:hypothetical protein|eukprot:SAG25_NODE_206_length_11883_cov_5.639511_11_plen_106_part_00
MRAARWPPTRPNFRAACQTSHTTSTPQASNLDCQSVTQSMTHRITLCRPPPRNVRECCLTRESAFESCRYTDVGVRTCGGQPGSYMHECQDAQRFASWGIDWLKV